MTWRLLRAAAETVDHQPLAPYVVGDRLIDLLLLIHPRPRDVDHWEPAYALGRGLRRLSAQALVREVEAGAQRVRRGWSDRDAWDVGSHVLRVTGEMLLHLAEVTHGWPDTRYATYEQWQEALRHHGEVLTRAARSGQDAEAAAASLRWVADHHVQLWD